MSDHEAASDFGTILEELATVFPKTKERQKFARTVWEVARQHDFWYGDMYIDRVLVKLGLARKSKKGSEAAEEQRTHEYFGYDYGEGS